MCESGSLNNSVMHLIKPYPIKNEAEIAALGLSLWANQIKKNESKIEKKESKIEKAEHNKIKKIQKR